ncbi:MAG: alpha/beta hydrolase [Chloroflexota bacterium]|nr:alpha/beta hydrolase [Chloroflexota bacterium]
MQLTPKMEEHRVEVDGTPAAYTARGPEDATHAYIGINGLMGGGDSFWPVIEGVPEDWRVVLPDLPGCGGSPPLPPPYKHDIDGYVQWLHNFVQSAGLIDKQLVIASVATGAPVSIRYTKQYPTGVWAQVLHLPFLGKLAISAKWARPIAAYSLLTPPLRALVNRLRASERLMHRIILHEPPDAIPELAERDIDHKQGADLHAAGQLLRSLMLADARVELAQIKSPLLILASEHDFAAPLPVLEGIVKGRPERKLYVYRGGQHSWNEEFIDEMNREIAEFLTQAEEPVAATL